MASVAIFCAIGAFSSDYQVTTVFVMFAFGILGLLMKKLGFPIAPLILGLVVGNDLLDANFRRAFLAGKGSFLPFVTRPASLILVILLILVIGKEFLLPVLKERRAKQKEKIES
jgi:putative tricarboxylic transport membrane protein